MSVFGGLPLGDIWTDPDVGFGEPVVYVPASTGQPVGEDGTINAIWQELYVTAGEDGNDARRVTLTVRVADIPKPEPGDAAKRVSTGERLIVCTPIVPDGFELIAVDLEKGC